MRGRLAGMDNGDEKGCENSYNELVSIMAKLKRTCFRRRFIFLDKQVHRGSAGVVRWGWVTLGSVASTVRRITSSFKRETPSDERRTRDTIGPRHVRAYEFQIFRTKSRAGTDWRDESELVVIRVVTTTISCPGLRHLTRRGNERGENYFWFESWCPFFTHVLWYPVDFYDAAFGEAQNINLDSESQY